MKLVALVGMCLVVGGGDCLSDDAPRVRPISEADEVMAVYWNSFGLASVEEAPALILAIWPDGYVVWSEDTVFGGKPYRSGHLDAKRVAALHDRFRRDGLLADESLNRPHFGPDSSYQAVVIKSAGKKVEMNSWHELAEEGKAVATARGLEPLEDRRRLKVLRAQPAEYLFFRTVWTETRRKLHDLRPSTGTPVDGELVMEAGEVFWREPAATAPANR